MLDVRVRAFGIALWLWCIVAVLGLADSLKIEVRGKLLADEGAAADGRYFLSDDQHTPICADPESYLQGYLTGSIGHQVTLRIEVEK